MSPTPLQWRFMNYTGKPMPEVRLLTTAEAAIFHQLRLRAVKEETRSFLESYEEAKQKPAVSYFENGWISGAFIGGALVGITGLFRHKGAKVEHKGIVWGVYVVPEARGKGLARRLIEAVVLEAAQAGLELVQISTDRTNAATQALYQSLGFEPYGTEKHIMKLPDGSYIDDVWMVKFLK